MQDSRLAPWFCVFLCRAIRRRWIPARQQHTPRPPGRRGGCISAFVFFFREHGQFGSTSERAPWTGSKVFREPLVIAQGSCTHLQDRLGAFGIVPEHLGSFHPVVDLLDE